MKILLLIDSEEDHKLLSDWLSKKYEIINTKNKNIEEYIYEEDFDLCILDSYHLEKYKKELEDRKKSENPYFLPYLLIVSSDIEDINIKIMDYIYDVVSVPIRKNILENRLENILDRRKKSLKLKQQQRDLEVDIKSKERALEKAPYGVTISTKSDSSFVYCNEKFSDFTGYNVKEIVGKTYKVLEGEETDSSIIEDIEDCLQDNVGGSFEFYSYRKDGSGFWNSLDIAPVSNSHGETVGFVGFHKDITERKIREKELREERALTKSIFRSVPDLVYAFDTEGNYLRVSESNLEVSGYTREDHIDMSPTDFVKDSDKEKITETIQRILETGETQIIEADLVTKDGEEIPYEFSASRMENENGEIIGVAGIGRDISERKKRERRIKAIFDQTYQFTGLLEPDGTLIEANNTALEFGGLDREDVIGKKVWETFWFQNSDETKEKTKEFIEKAANGKFIRDELEVQGKDREAIIDFSIRPVKNEKGNVTLLIPEGRDITERVKKQKRLNRILNLLDETETLADVGGWELNLENEELLWTGGTKRIHEVSEEFEPTLEDAIDFYHPEDRDTIENLVDNSIEKGESYNRDLRLITADGNEKWVEVLGKPEKTDKDIEKIRGAISDISDRKRREQRLSVLTRVLRHDILNTMNIILTNAEFLQKDMSGNNQEIMATIVKNARNIVDISNQSRDIQKIIKSKRETKRQINLADILRDRLELIENNYSKVKIETDISNSIEVYCEPLIDSAIDNLLENALKHNDKEKPKLSISIKKNNDSVKLTIEDNGPGIPEEKIKVLEKGKETDLEHLEGLDLWIVNWVIEESNGKIKYKQNKPTGGKIEVTLPKTKTEK